ncbi:hypothetical protein CA13_71700 [Planctomycetes bacterium CA13]|uniref:Uncharacterized protein n=1 Tax=Novipirellula herctigrandis TaxID=2527986 RepID=A0A5C5YP90_9BACT|nr:hypothetical protein CA13_71700 [Planctomycetes bacterium CA13]
MLRFLFSSIAILLVVGVLAPGKVDASCGDWLAHPEDLAHSEDLAHPEDLAHSEDVDRPVVEQTTVTLSVATAAETPIAWQPTSRKKCSGPLCGQSPTKRVPNPPASDTEQTTNDFGVLWVGDLGGLSEIGFSLEGNDGHRLSGHRDGIERPPRF